MADPFRRWAPLNPWGGDCHRWLGSQLHAHKILIAGNHDFVFERYTEWARRMCRDQGITYLEDKEITISDFTLYGSPWTPVFRQMAFNAIEDEMTEHRSKIPESTNVLITHGPALKAHICGHIHESYGFAIRESDGVKFTSALTCTERYRASNPAVIIDI